MTHPEYIYWAAVALIAWPASMFSRCAGILAVAWAVGQIAYVIGLPEPLSQVVIYIIAGLLTLKHRREFPCLIVAAFYLPLAIMSAATHVDPDLIWWGIFWTAMAQVLVVPFTVHWAEVREVRHALKDRRNFDNNLFRLFRAVLP